MGVFRRIKGTIKKVGAFIVALPIVIKVVALLTIIVSASIFLADLYEMITAENTPKKIYEDLEIEDVAELIQIKGNKDTGYYLDFVDDIDTKLEALVETLNTDWKYHNVPTDIEFLKKLIQAEVVTKFPNLGGDIPEGESGFQGAIDIKRATPNKEVGELKNTGKGETTLLEPESSYTDLSITPREEEIKSWEEGKNLVLYNDCYVYDEEDNVWIKREDGSKYVIIRRTDTVTYTGKYEKVEDKLNDIVTFYVEVKSGDITGYIQSKNINIRSSDPEEEENQSDETATRQNVQVSSRAPEDSREKEIVGNENEEYRVAIAAGHNNTDDKGARNGDLIEEDLTIQVAEKVEELINEKYENVTVIQTGSTSSNPGGIKAEDRTKLAREAEPDLCIQIHFDAITDDEGNPISDTNGVSVIYKEEDYYSQQLAEILAESISSSMGLTNRGDGPDTERTAVKNLGIIESYATSGFPSVVTEGGFLTGNVDADVIKNGNGVEKYAQGIVEGIKTYLESDHSGLTAVDKGTTEITTSIESRIVNMKYLSPEELEEMKNSGNVKEATKYFTLDEDNKLVTLTWGQNGEGTIEIRENAAIDFRTALQKYHMPFEYLLYYYIDTNYRDFSEKLADIVLDSEIVITLQDNITTTQTFEDTEVKVETSTNIGNAKGLAHDWEVEASSHKETITEFCNTRTDITYIETWCVKNYKDNSFSEKVLNMGDQDEIIVNVPGQVTYTKGTTTRDSGEVFMTSFRSTGVQNADGNDIGYTYRELHRRATTVNTLSNSYDSSGDMKIEGITNKYVDLYIEESMNQRMQEGWFFKIVKKNEKTSNLLDLTKYLMFLASNTNYGVTTFDFSVFEFDTVFGASGGLGLLNITSTTFTREEFIAAVQSYSPAISKGSATQVFRDNAGLIYDVCVKNNINPVLCAAQAWQEQGWDDPSTSPFNYWGIAVYNGQNYGNSYASMEDAVQGYCDQINKQINGNLRAEYQARAAEFATVNSKFKGDMSTIYDVFSAYAYIGDGHTLQEEADYAAAYVEKVMQCATQIFGEGALVATSGSASTAYAHADAYTKVANLFPNGIPQNHAELMPYLTTIKVPATSKNGTKIMISVQLHKAIAQDVYNACYAAQQEGFKVYEIGGYGQWRWNDNAGKAGGLSHSQHCYGLAVDINSRENGEFRNGAPTGNWFYAPGSNPYSIKPDSALVQTFKAAGWGWGGEWNSSKDYMHFSFCGT